MPVFNDSRHNYIGHNYFYARLQRQSPDAIIFIIIIFINIIYIYIVIFMPVFNDSRPTAQSTLCGQQPAASRQQASGQQPVPTVAPTAAPPPNRAVLAQLNSTQRLRPLAGHNCF